MNVTFLAPSGAIVTDLLLEPTQSILEIKQLLVSICKTAPCRQQLVKDNAHLSDTTLIQDLELESCSFITLVLLHYGWKPMHFPAALHFSYVRAMTGRDLRQEFSVSLWFKPFSCDAHGAAVSKQRNDGTGWRIELCRGVGVRFAGMSANFLHVVPEFVPCRIGEWHHAAAVISLAELRGHFYLDGVRVTSFDTFGPFLSDAAQALVIGREWDESEGSGWTGATNLEGGRKLLHTALLQVVVWDSALSDSEIQSLYRCTTTPEAIQEGNVVVVLEGVGEDGEVLDTSTRCSEVTVRMKDDEAIVSHECSMNAVDNDLPQVFQQ